MNSQKLLRFSASIFVLCAVCGVSACSYFPESWGGTPRTLPKDADVDFANRRSPDLNYGNSSAAGVSGRRVPVENSSGASKFWQNNQAVAAPVVNQGAYPTLASVPQAPVRTPKENINNQFSNLSTERVNSENTRTQLMNNQNATVMTSPQTGKLVASPDNAIASVNLPSGNLATTPQVKMVSNTSDTPKSDGNFNGWLNNLFSGDKAKMKSQPAPAVVAAEVKAPSNPAPILQVPGKVAVEVTPPNLKASETQQSPFQVLEKPQDLAKQVVAVKPPQAPIFAQPATSAVVIAPQNNVVEAKPVPVQIVENKAEEVKPVIAESDKKTSSWFGSIFSSKKDDAKEAVVKANEEAVKVEPVVAAKPIEVVLPPKPAVTLTDSQTKNDSQAKFFEQPVKSTIAVPVQNNAPMVLMPQSNAVIEAKPVPVQIVEKKAEEVKPVIAESDKKTSSWLGSVFSSKKDDAKEIVVKVNEEEIKVEPVVTAKPIEVAVPPAVVSVEKPPIVAEDTKAKISDDVSVLATPYEPIIKLTPPREDSYNANSDVRYLGESRYSGRVQQGGN